MKRMCHVTMKPRFVRGLFVCWLVVCLFVCLFGQHNGDDCSDFHVSVASLLKLFYISLEKVSHFSFQALSFNCVFPVAGGDMGRYFKWRRQS